MSGIRQRTPLTATGTATTTVTLDQASSSSSSSQQQQPLILTMELNRRKKKVTWKEGTVDNEFLNKKSSKKCCIFHKEKSFDHDDSEDDGDGCDRPNKDGDHDHGHGCCSNRLVKVLIASEECNDLTDGIGTEMG
ncbi:unnamed protein product [Thlaspi arvense]|uniref:Uncharacterized protein n=1 Tax=Thlaspi arvense TaxID=13288 RepID=A0AAU9T7W4_THLAR|nr:unnamed protein product [Thlaspi arvense]